MNRRTLWILLASCLCLSMGCPTEDDDDAAGDDDTGDDDTGDDDTGDDDTGDDDTGDDDTGDDDTAPCEIPTNGYNVNSCGDGQYSDTTIDMPPLCKPLIRPDLGFDCGEFMDGFPLDEVVLTEKQCTVAAINAAIQSLAPKGGGTVILPACTVTLTEAITVNVDHLILQGASVSQTQIEASALIGYSGPMIHVDHARDVVIRDMRVLALGGLEASALPLVVDHSTNVLCERLELQNGSAGLSFANSAQFTVRFVACQDHFSHGISVNECHDGNGDGLVTLGECAAAEAPNGVFPSQDYAIHSCSTRENGDQGLDIHASLGEIAGSNVWLNQNAGRLVDTHQVWFHHNELWGNHDGGLRLGPLTQDDSMAPTDVLVHANIFDSNAVPSGYAVDLSGPTTGTDGVYWFLHNEYTDNGQAIPIQVVGGAVDAINLCDDGPDDTTDPALEVPISCKPLPDLATLF